MKISESKFRAWHKRDEEYRQIVAIQFDEEGRMSTIDTVNINTGHDPQSDVIEAFDIELLEN